MASSVSSGHSPDPLLTPSRPPISHRDGVVGEQRALSEVEAGEAGAPLGERAHAAVAQAGAVAAVEVAQVGAARKRLDARAAHVAAVAHVHFREVAAPRRERRHAPVRQPLAPLHLHHLYIYIYIYATPGWVRNAPGISCAREYVRHVPLPEIPLRTLLALCRRRRLQRESPAFAVGTVCRVSGDSVVTKQDLFPYAAAEFLVGLQSGREVRVKEKPEESPNPGQGRLLLDAYDESTGPLKLVYYYENDLLLFKPALDSRSTGAVRREDSLISSLNTGG
eukprot:1195739-Prorocentrum_minimum.AAC.10